MRRRRRMSHAAGLALAAALGVSPLPSLAQSPPPAPNSDSTLLAPSLENAPANPPPFRMPGEAPPPSNNRSLPAGTFTGAQSRIGATPVYGSPSGFGAGDTGFDSSNTPHGKKKKRTQAAAPGGPTKPQPDTTFAPVPNFAPPAPSQPPVLKKPPPAEIAPSEAACLSPLWVSSAVR